MPKNHTLLAITITVLKPNGETKTRTLENADLKNFSALSWENLDGGTDELIAAFHTAKNETGKATDARNKRAKADTALLIKKPNCDTDSWP